VCRAIFEGDHVSPPRKHARRPVRTNAQFPPARTRGLPVVYTGGITQRAGDAISFGLSALLKLPAVSPRERQRFQQLGRCPQSAERPLPTFCLLSYSRCCEFAGRETKMVHGTDRAGTSGEGGDGALARTFGLLCSIGRVRSRVSGLPMRHGWPPALMLFAIGSQWKWRT
jgi:hypothetical protein